MQLLCIILLTMNFDNPVSPVIAFIVMCSSLCILMTSVSFPLYQMNQNTIFAFSHIRFIPAGMSSDTFPVLLSPH